MNVASPIELTAPWSDAERALALLARDVRSAPPEVRLVALRAGALGLRRHIDQGFLNPAMVEDKIFTLAESLNMGGEPGSPEEAEIYAIARDSTALPGFRDDEEPPAPEGPADCGLASPEDAARQSQPPKLAFIEADSLATRSVPARRWLVPNRIPMAVPTLLTGDGGLGKTKIALQLAAATTRGTDWLGAVIDAPGPVIFFTAEEDVDEVHRRLEEIVVHHAIGLADLTGLHFLSLPGKDAVLGGPDRGGQIRPTALFQGLHAAAIRIRPSLIVIETAADVYSGNENDRAQVRQFVGLLRKLAIDSGAAVVLLAHPSLHGLSSGGGTSGSTGWNNSVRSRLNLTTSKTRDGDDPDSDIRELKVVKSNYGPSGETIRLRWQRGVFVPEGSPAPLQQLVAQSKAEDVFLRLLADRNAQGRWVTPNKASGYAPKELAAMAGAESFTAAAFARAMERLFSSNRIVVETVGPPTKQRKHLIVAPTNRLPTGE